MPRPAETSRACGVAPYQTLPGLAQTSVTVPGLPHPACRIRSYPCVALPAKPCQATYLRSTQHHAAPLLPRLSNPGPAECIRAEPAAPRRANCSHALPDHALPANPRRVEPPMPSLALPRRAARSLWHSFNFLQTALQTNRIPIHSIRASQVDLHRHQPARRRE